MPDILIRKIPKELKTWIDDQSHSARTSTNAFLIDLLDSARKGNERQLELFDSIPLDDEPQSANGTQVPFTFCDLFAGIGGIRLGLEAVGGDCVFSCEYDKYAQKTYQAWHGEMPHGDIRDLDLSEFPDHDVLAAGFPCQPFSIAGVSKKNSLGRKHGFLDKTQGTLFFHLATIIEVKRPPVIMLENVKNLMSHDKGKTWQVIQDTLDKLDYEIHFQVIDAADYVPQHRKRVFIVGFDRKIFKGRSGFQFAASPNGNKPKFRDILTDDPAPKYTLTDKLWNYLQEYAERHRRKGNGFGFGMTDLDGVSRTLSARYYKDGSEVLIPNGPSKNPRRLTPREAARLMGFPDHLEIVCSDTQAYKQFGNAVVPPVAKSVGRQIVQVFANKITKRNGCLLKKGST
ncbi:DNA (cytosine-5-)-methyltransferase [Mariniblastus sp.]|nr:DNA (cytosine-5-)-methyltransferase [Mariniblastus sp.]